MDPIRIAVLDLYEGEANEGMRCIRQLLEHFKNDHQLDLTYQVFDVRMKKEIADLGFDAYISSIFGLVYVHYAKGRTLSFFYSGIMIMPAENLKGMAN